MDNICLGEPIHINLVYGFSSLPFSLFPFSSFSRLWFRVFIEMLRNVPFDSDTRSQFSNIGGAIHDSSSHSITLGALGAQWFAHTGQWKPVTNKRCNSALRRIRIADKFMRLQFRRQSFSLFLFDVVVAFFWVSRNTHACTHSTHSHNIYLAVVYVDDGCCFIIIFRKRKTEHETQLRCYDYYSNCVDSIVCLWFGCKHFRRFDWHW